MIAVPHTRCPVDPIPEYLCIEQREGLAAVARLNPTASERAEIEHVTETYVRFVPDKDVRSLRTMRALLS